MQKILLALICLLGLAQCHNKVHSLQDLPKQFIEMGSYGGFAGTAKTYFFFPNGQRFLNQGLMGAVDTTNAREIEKTSPKAFKEILKSLKKIDFKDVELNEVGNKTYFIKLKTKKQEKKVQWSNMDTAPQALVDLYRSTLKTVNTAAIN